MVVVKVSGMNNEPLVITIDTFNNILRHDETSFQGPHSTGHVANASIYGRLLYNRDQRSSDM